MAALQSTFVRAPLPSQCAPSAHRHMSAFRAPDRAAAAASTGCFPCSGNRVAHPSFGHTPGITARGQACSAAAMGQLGCLSRDRPLSAALRQSVSVLSTSQADHASWHGLSQMGPTLRLSSATPSAAVLAESPAAEGAVEAAAEDSDAPEKAVIRIHTPEELKEQLEIHGHDLVVLMCKAHSCRPCKMFMRKYQRIAQQYRDRNVTFLEIFGDDSKETRQLMISMSIRVTPNFRLYRDGQLVHQLTGVNETNLRNAVEEN
mmetsp:Transcript_748/g.2282  ORF Transcript_748/g.2282 Transcript_748/m.2282 type:complete len:260 (-) Transcript_748:789-1568(-)|eukprot:CAMPEP_0206139924 /NCGR_PEP_ID=MMETSP1473-20131121/7808_1 /ASSEMBLY_ACC=CAM_ASM_001109 /TAXON_ID=1461547 /ORGANISM="Stichococcus sp, Strain RCC1054" /LENGTH=259 /DNA_ID=CAMNT_0053533875 /DNA_START=216 /DNA_END=995 /DNA_ORIENTATION=-